MSSRVRHVVLRDRRGSGSDLVPRSNDVAITQKLETVWPSVSVRLATMLRRRGVGRHDADEAIQETAARAISTGVEFVDGDDLFRWASVVSWRVAVDARRRCTRISDGELPDRADHVDVQQAAEHRIVLSAVTTRFKDLSERDRAVLLASFDEQPVPSRSEAVRLAVARHRARSRLRGLLDGLAAPVAAFAARRWRWRSAHVEALAASAAPALACLALSVGTFAVPTPNIRTGPRAVAIVAAVPEAQATPATSVTADKPAHASVRSEELPAAPIRNDIVRLPPTPDGKPTEVGSRPRQATDHLACATLPSLTGPAKTCVDPPPIGH